MRGGRGVITSNPAPGARGASEGLVSRAPTSVLYARDSENSTVGGRVALATADVAMSVKPQREQQGTTGHWVFYAWYLDMLAHITSVFGHVSPHHVGIWTCRPTSRRYLDMLAHIMSVFGHVGLHHVGIWTCWPTSRRYLDMSAHITSVFGHVGPHHVGIWTCWPTSRRYLDMSAHITSVFGHVGPHHVGIWTCQPTSRRYLDMSAHITSITFRTHPVYNDGTNILERLLV
ncbi:hypothetical protein Btru_043606 [Bulinus truncatus]|nr:hypothetical protein Btru_043606 [Bulinus truncatus]